jgi:hypothetical protein
VKHLQLDLLETTFNFTESSSWQNQAHELAKHHTKTHPNHPCNVLQLHHNLAARCIPHPYHVMQNTCAISMNYSKTYPNIMDFLRKSCVVGGQNCMLELQLHPIQLSTLGRAEISHSAWVVTQTIK